jgi:hypothetical protein
MRRRVYLFYWLFITRPEWDCHKASERENEEYQFLLLAIETSKTRARFVRSPPPKSKHKKVAGAPQSQEDTPFACSYL